MEVGNYSDMGEEVISLAVVVRNSNTVEEET